MTTRRAMALCGFVGLFSASSLAQSQTPASHPPPNVSIGPLWTRDLTSDNQFMPGISAEFDWTAGRSQRLAIEASYHWQQYRPTPAFTARIRRGGGSVAGRFGRPSGYGPFFQLALGRFVQSVEGGTGRDRARYAVGSNWWVGPGLGVEIKVSQRIGVRAVAELMWLPSEPKRHAVGTRYRAGLVYKLPSRQK